MLKEIKILRSHGKQYIPDITKPVLPDTFKGRPIISHEVIENNVLIDLCPTNAISDEEGIRIDVGKCTFCGECAFRFPDKVRFSNDYKTATNKREALIIKEGNEQIIKIDP